MKPYIELCMNLVSESVSTIVKHSKSGKKITPEFVSELEFMFGQRPLLSFGFICDCIGENPDTWRNLLLKKTGLSRSQVKELINASDKDSK